MRGPERTDDPPSFGTDSGRSWMELLELPPFEFQEVASLTWSSPIAENAPSKGIPGSPTVVDGRVYVANGVTLYELNATNGTVTWSYESTFGTNCAPTVVGGTAYFVTVFGSVVAIEIGSDETRWESETTREYSLVFRGETPSPLVVDGTVYVGKAPSDLYAYNAETGSVEWVFPTDGEIVTSAVSFEGTVIAPTRQGTLYGIDAGDGSERWSISIEGLGDSAPTIADGTLFIGSRTGSVYAIDPQSGETVWTVEREGEILSTPTVADGTVFVTDSDEFSPVVAAFDVETGDSQWTSDRGISRSSPTVAGERVYFGSTYVEGYGVSSGEREFTFTDVGGGFNSSPTVVNGTLYAGGPGRDLLAIDTDTDATSRGSRIRHGTHGHTNSLTGAEGASSGAGSDSAGSTPGGPTQQSGDDGEGDGALSGPGILGATGSLLGTRLLLGTRGGNDNGSQSAASSDSESPESEMSGDGTATGGAGGVE